MITIDPTLNPLEVILVTDHMKARGQEHYSLYPGNNCIWAASGSSSRPINEYFVFRGGKLVDIQID